MATSSITHNFVLSDRESAEGFIHAVEEAERDQSLRIVSGDSYGRLLTDRKEIIALMSRRK